MTLAGRLTFPLQHLILGLPGNGQAPSSVKYPAQVSATWGGTQSGTANTSLSFTGQTVNIGDFIVIGGLARGATLPTGLTLTTSLGNTYANLASLNNNAGSAAGGLWAGFVGTGGTETLGFTWTNAGAAVGTASRWRNIGGTTGSNALDVAVVTANPAGAPGAVGPSAATVSPNDLVIALAMSNGAITFSSQAFNPVGSSIAVPDTLFQSSGTDNCSIQFASTISGGTGVTQSYSWTIGNNGTWIGILACFKHV